MPLTLEQFPNKPLCRFSVSTRLNQDIQHIPVLVYRPPQVVLLSVDADKHLVKMPDITRPPCPGPNSFRILRPEAQTPLPDRIVVDLYSSTPQDLFHVAKAQREPVVKPHRVTDDLAWMPEYMIQRNVVIHGFTLPWRRQLDSALRGFSGPVIDDFSAQTPTSAVIIE